MKYAIDKVVNHMTIPSNIEEVTVREAPKLKAFWESKMTIKTSWISKNDSERFPIAVIAFMITPRYFVPTPLYQ